MVKSPLVSLDNRTINTSPQRAYLHNVIEWHRLQSRVLSIVSETQELLLERFKAMISQVPQSGKSGYGR